MSNSIVAISTAFGEAAIAVIRLSGPQVVSMLETCFKPQGRSSQFPLAARVQHYGQLLGDEGQILDSVLACIFRGPASYTGEDVVEISCHGGILVTKSIYERFLHLGARAAEPGEFTQRAFLNGKMDLTQAEAVMDLIHAQSEQSLKAATQQLEGKLGSQAEAIRHDLIHLLAHIEAYIDFPDEDIDPDTGEALVQRLTNIAAIFDQLLSTAEHGRILRQGAMTVICGEPNVGKSSLLNSLLGSDRAIVSAKAGTTRDTIEELLHIHGLPFRLVDTAGIRESEDEIEQVGIERTAKAIAQADVILEVVDGSKSVNEAIRVNVPTHHKGHLLILNKGDLGCHPSWEGWGGVEVSCTEQQNFDVLRSAMRDAVYAGSGGHHAQLVAINARHQHCFQQALQSLESAKLALLQQKAPEYVALELRECLHHVGEVTGRVDIEEIISAIFSTFCLGK